MKLKKKSSRSDFLNFFEEKKFKIEKIIFVRELKKRLFEETFFEIEIFGPRFSIFRNPYCPSLKVSSLKSVSRSEQD